MEIRNIEREERWIYGVSDEGYDSDIDDGMYVCSIIVTAIQSLSVETKMCLFIKTNNHIVICIDDIVYSGNGEYGHFIVFDSNNKIKATLHESFLNNDMFFEGSWQNAIDNDSMGFWKIKILSKR